MNNNPSRLTKYLVAILSVTAATFLQLLLDPILGHAFPFASLLLAITVSAWYGGFGPAVAAALFGAFMAAWLLIPPYPSLLIQDVEHQLGLVFYLLVGLATALLGGSMRTAQFRAEARARELRESREALRRSEADLRDRMAELAESQDRIRSVMDNVIDGIITVNEEGIVESINPAAQRLFGYSAADVLGRNVSLLMPEPYRSEHDGYIRRYRETGRARIIGIGREVYGLRKDGSTFPMDLAISEFWFGGRRFFTGILRDITERRRTENALRFLADASRVLSQVVDYESTLQKVAGLAVPHFADWCAIDVMEPDGNLKRVAVAHVDPTRVSMLYELDRRYPPDPNTPAGPGHVMRTGEPELVAEIPESMLAAVSRDEEHLAILRELGPRSFISVPLAVHAKVTGVITFAAAESGRHYDETDLALCEEIAQRAAIAMDNARLYSELRRSDRLKTEFLAMLAHELRNPLAPIRNALHIMKLPAADEAVLDQARNIAERQIHHLTRLVDDLLDVSRIMRGKIELRMERIELAAVLDRAIETSQPLIDAGRHRLEVARPVEPVHLRGDLVRLSQVVSNLLNNAAKYTEKGGRIRLSAGASGQAIEIRVSDNGIGIETAMLPRVFEMFVQADQSVKRSQGGMGIGLTLVKRLVEMHGGMIRAHSEGIGKGSEFVVRLPAALGAAPQSAEPQVALERMAIHPRRILVVDDNVDAADSVALLLKLAGQDVELAYDGITALRKARSHRPEVVFLDIGMPRMDGYEVARRLRTEPVLKGIQIVAVTGWGQEEDRARTREAGFDYHMVKPVEPQDLQIFLASLDDLPGFPGDNNRS